MNYFFQLLSSLNERELATLSIVHFTPTERKIFEFMRGYTGEECDLGSAVTHALGVLPNPFYKNSSILLQKAHNALVPEGGLALLVFLIRRKFLVPNGLRELERQERSSVLTLSPAERERYYFAVFHILRSAEKIEIPIESFEAYGKRYLDSQVKPKPEHEIAITIYLEQRRFTKDIKQTKKRFDESYIHEYRMTLDRHAASLEGSADAFAKYSLHSAYYNYHYLTRFEPYAMKEHLDQVLQSIPTQLREQFPWFVKARELDEGTIYNLTGEYEKCYQFYKEHFDPEIAEYVSMRVPMDYFMSALYTGHYEVASELIMTIYGKDLERPLENSKSSVIGAIWLTFLNLDWAKFDQAIENLTNALQWNSKGNYSPYNESIIRTLEIVYHFLTKDWDFCELLITRYRQWLRRNALAEADSPEIPFLTITREYLDAILDGKPLRDNIEEVIHERFHREMGGLVEMLLLKMRSLTIKEKASMHWN